MKRLLFLSILAIIFIPTCAISGTRITADGMYEIPDMGECIDYPYQAMTMCCIGELTHPITKSIIQLIDSDYDGKYNFAFAWQWMVDSEGNDVGWLPYGQFGMDYEKAIEVIYHICGSENRNYPDRLFEIKDCISFASDQQIKAIQSKKKNNL